MKILILGAGRTGSSVASALAHEDNDIVVVDMSPQLLRELKERLDIATVVGNAAFPPILEQAGAGSADIVIAVTDKDETNMLACQVVNTLYSRPKTIARVRASEFLNNPELFREGGIPIDVVISPELIVMDYIRNLIEFPGVLYVSEFAGGLVRLFSVRISRNSMLTRKRIRTLKEHLANSKIRIAAIFRDGKAVVPDGAAVIEEGDEIFIMAPRNEVRKVLNDLKKLEPPMKRILIAGGGHIGKRLALALENGHQVKIIEQNPDRTRKIASQLDNTLVLQGDCTDETLLISESIDKTDLFCALTNHDGSNIISATLAKRLGARKSICLINHASYVDLLEGSGIDVWVEPEQTTIGSILKHVRRGDVVQVNSLCGGRAEAIEAIAHGPAGSSSVIGRQVDQINLPYGIILGALVRDNEMMMIHHDTVFEEGDHVIMFVMDKKLVRNVEKVFQPI
ncbi:MAG: Trk system potassium transporter TrkA [Methylococcaceae bacterium]|nr:Trk system potassium transporter TrkA [Methylococcaceae bacterium]MCI0732507.1 Trk system potassium transporter TrkA [Methylococcaceae bacterium]